MGRLEGKTAVITGAADGIGFAISKAMAREGAHVFMGDINDDKGAAAAASLVAEGGRATFFHCDVAVETDIANLIDQAARTGHVDVLVNNAAIAIGGMPLHEMTDEQWHRLIAVNLTSVFRGIKHVLPHMIRQRWGSVISMASAALNASMGIWACGR